MEVPDQSSFQDFKIARGAIAARGFLDCLTANSQLSEDCEQRDALLSLLSV